MRRTARPSRKRKLSAIIDRKALQLRLFDLYVTQYGRPYPATVQDVVGWIGWLSERSLQDGDRKI